MHKESLIDAVAIKAGITRLVSRNVVEAVFEVIADAARKGEQVNVSNFGVFAIHKTPPRVCRNPQTGAAVPVAERHQLKLRVAKGLKAELAKQSWDKPETEKAVSTLKYALTPGFIRSVNDGGVHYVDYRTLASLYCVSLDECLVIPELYDNGTTAAQAALATRQALKQNLVFLRPKADGNYTLPLRGQE